MTERHPELQELIDCIQLRSSPRELREALERVSARYLGTSDFIAELIAARTVLAEMVPSNELRIDGFRLSGWIRPAHYVGGDCFDYFSWREQARFFIADAVGHGLAATMMSLECRALWRAFSRTRSPADTASALNEILSSDERGIELFVGSCLGEIEPASGTVRYVCGGLAPYLTVDADGGVCAFEDADPPLGVVPGASFREHSRVLARGESMLFLTDGILERLDEGGAPFGQERLVELVREARSAGRPVLEELGAALDTFGARRPPQDDACALLIELL